MYLFGVFLDVEVVYYVENVIRDVIGEEFLGYC